MSCSVGNEDLRLEGQWASSDGYLFYVFERENRFAYIALS